MKNFDKIETAKAINEVIIASLKSAKEPDSNQIDATIYLLQFINDELLVPDKKKTSESPVLDKIT